MVENKITEADIDRVTTSIMRGLAELKIAFERGAASEDPTVDDHEKQLARLMSQAEIPCSPTIRESDLARLDQIIGFFSAILPWAAVDMYDDAWNLRNHLVPFVPGDWHYDPTIEDLPETAEGEGQ